MLPERELIERVSSADPTTSSTRRRRRSGSSTARSAAAFPSCSTSTIPAMIGAVQNQDSYTQGVAAQRPFFFDHIAELTDRRWTSSRASPAGATSASPRLPHRRRRVCDPRQGSMVVERRSGGRLPARDARDQGRRASTSRCSVRSRAICVAQLLQGQEGRSGAGAHRPAAGRGPAADARDPRGDGAAV